MVNKDLLFITNNFQEELKKAAHRKPSSLPYIRNQLSSHKVKDGELFQVMVVGGTNYKSALVKRNNTIIEIVSEEQATQSVFDTDTMFFAFITENLAPHISTLAINFAYALEPVSTDHGLDGILLAGKKNSAFEGLVGKQIGKLTERYITKKVGRSINITVANDTVCPVLAGLTLHPWNELACFIAGTGMNGAFFENENSIVNVESANFACFPHSEALAYVDSVSIDKGKHLWEKEISGAHLYNHLNFVIQKLNWHYPLLTDTAQLSQLAEHNTSPVGIRAKEILRRSAELVACQIAAISLFRAYDMTFIMQGSLYWKGFGYKETVAETVRQLCPHYQITYIKLDNADIIGAAKLVA